ncbi:MAG TPA: hypothetical protein VKK79_05880 [Candidatus Lokiarchaeia archaeon]|nr:hypothetical protein [Candidatus Lokiarchaeia archaeon]
MSALCGGDLGQAQLAHGRRVPIAKFSGETKQKYPAGTSNLSSSGHAMVFHILHTRIRQTS